MKKSGISSILLMKQYSVIVAILVLSAVLPGCVNLASWERGNLAKSQMALEPHPLQNTNRAHNYGSREAGASANSVGGGGGCGCF